MHRDREKTEIPSQEVDVKVDKTRSGQIQNSTGMPSALTQPGLIAASFKSGSSWVATSWTSFSDSRNTVLKLLFQTWRNSRMILVSGWAKIRGYILALIKYLPKSLRINRGFRRCIVMVLAVGLLCMVWGNMAETRTGGDAGADHEAG